MGTDNFSVRLHVHVVTKLELKCNNRILLYLPTKIRFLIEREHVTRRGSKLTNSLGKQHELSTRTWSGCIRRIKRKRFLSPKFFYFLSWEVKGF